MDWNSLASQVKAQIDAYGADITISHTAAGSMNVAAGTVTPGGTTDYIVKGLAKAPKQNSAPGTLMRTDLVTFLVPAISLPITPAAGDKVALGTVVYTVINNAPLFPGGTHLMHKLTCGA